MRMTVVAAIMAATLLTPTAATAASPSVPGKPPNVGWTLALHDNTGRQRGGVDVGPDPTVAPHPRTAHSSAAQRAMAEEDLKTECAKHSEAHTDQGWAHSRFDQCYLLTDAELLLKDLITGEVLGKIKFSSSLLVFAYDGERRIDYVFTFDNYAVDYVNYPNAKPYYDASALTVGFDGCSASIVCSPTPPSRTETAAGWQSASSRTFQISVTSANDTGAGTLKIARSLISMKLAIASAVPNIAPFEKTVAYSRGRFDSALGTLGGGKYWGAIMSDFIPTLSLDRSATSPYRAEAVHVDDALHRPIRTFPSFIGKSVPGEGNRPLHRLMDQTVRTANNNASRAICQDVWGPNYANGGLQCDEYPFQSTYEGSFSSTGGDASRWNGSARPIDGTQNGLAGNHLQQFYNLNRVLDENLGSTTSGPTDPFRVAVIG